MQAEKLDKSIYDIQEMAREKRIILSACRRICSKKRGDGKKECQKIEREVNGFLKLFNCIDSTL